jgi:hypothetical protein
MSSNRFIIFLLLFFVSCNPETKVKSAVSTEIDKVVKENKEEIERLEREVSSKYYSYSSRVNKESNRKLADTIYYNFGNVVHYIDSAFGFVHQMEFNNVDNVQEIRDLFIDHKVGDTLEVLIVKTLKSASSLEKLTKNSSISDSVCKSILSVSKNSTSWTRDTFENVNEVATLFILLELKKEICIAVNSALD